MSVFKTLFFIVIPFEHTTILREFSYSRFTKPYTEVSLMSICVNIDHNSEASVEYQ